MFCCSEGLQNMKCQFTTISSITICLLLLGITLSFKKSSNFIGNAGNVFYSYQSLPAFSIYSHEHDTPHRISGTSMWIDAVLQFIESTYRSFYIFNFREVDEGHTLQFSNEALNTYINFIRNNSTLVLPSSMKDYTAKTFLSISKSKEFSRSFIPSKYCKFINCSNFTDIINNNLFEFELIGHKIGYNVDDIKQMILKSEQPCLLTIPRPLAKFIKMCDNNLNCNDTFDAILPNGMFYLPNNPALLGYGEPLTMLLYGYSDDFSLNLRNNKVNTINLSRGGFIVKMPFKNSGNAIGLYDGSLTLDENNQICGNNYSPFYWKEDEPLKCIDEKYCDRNFNYSLYFYNFSKPETILKEQENGLTSVKMIKYNQSLKILFDFDKLPFQNLNLAFNPISIYDNFNKDLCGYGFIPYNLIDELTAISTHSKDQVHAIYLATKWSESSYSFNDKITFDIIKPRETSKI